MTVVKGIAELQNGGKGILRIEAGNGAILHWKDFSIAASERVQFVQPGVNAWVLNKVTGNGRSEIFGRLESNGQVVLLNPNGILFAKGSVVEVGGLIASSLKDVIHEGSIAATSGAVALMGQEVLVSGEILSRVGKHAYVRTQDNPFGIEIKKVGGRIFVWSVERTEVTHEGMLQGESVLLLSEGTTHFQGRGEVGDIEISGKKGFFHEGGIERTGSLLLDPESDVTISTIASYNYSMDMGPRADISNITIDKLIEEIEKGPVTITTTYQGEGGAEGSIILKGDVNRTYHSPYPLIFHTAGKGGIQIQGALTNTGEGAIEMVAPLTQIEGKLVGSNFKIEGNLMCSGELYGKNLTLFSKGNSEISGRMIIDGGNLLWKTEGNIRLAGGEWGHLGGGFFQIDGVRNFLVEEGSHLYATSRTTGITIKNLSEAFSIEKGRVSAGGAPLLIMGKTGAVSLYQGTLDSTAPITMDVGRHFHLDQSHLTSQKLIKLHLGDDLLLMRGSTLSSPSGVSVHAKGDLTLLDTSSISGRGLSLMAGNTLTLLDQASFKGGTGPLSVTAGKHLHLDGPKVTIQGGQVSVHAGETLTLEDHAQIISSMGNASVTAGFSMRLDDIAEISARGGDLDLVVTRGNLHLYGNSALSSTTHGANIIAGKSVVMENFSHIESIGEKGTTIVVDHLGSQGGMMVGVNASITTGHSPLQIFSAKRSLNSIQGTLNGHRHTPSLLYLNTTTEQWGINYPSFIFASPFTLFHKENGLIQTVGGGISQIDFCRIVINFIGPNAAEMQRNLHPYNEFTSKVISFTDGDGHYWIRTPTRSEEGIFHH